MWVIVIVTSVLAACSTVPPRQAPPAPKSELAADHERKIRRVFEQWEHAWQTHNMHAWAQLFHEDGTYITWIGGVWVGRQAIENGMVEAHKTVFKDSIQLSCPEEIRLLAPGVVVVRSFTTLTGDAREPQASILGRKLVVLTQRNGEWKILYGQAVRIPPAVAAPTQK